MDLTLDPDGIIKGKNSALPQSLQYFDRQPGAYVMQNTMVGKGEGGGGVVGCWNDLWKKLKNKGEQGKKSIKGMMRYEFKGI